MSVATLTARHQVSIPREIRERLSLKPGSKIAFIPKDDGYMLVRVPEREELFGTARGADPENYRDRNDRY